MSELDKRIEEVEGQETELLFDRFTNEDALDLGLKLVEAARGRGVSVTVDIERSGQKLFHYAMEGTTPDNDQWIRRKNNVVMRTFKSSFHVGLLLARDGISIVDKYFLDPMEFSAHGGSFPMRIRGMGVVGTIAVSGLPQEEDHMLVVTTIREFLEGQR